jgi:SAM-dependent methyltransferase
METCYKVFRTDLLKSIPVRSNRFGFEPEITMKCAKRKLRIYEVPISYHGRTYEEGKKIGWKDGVKVFGVLLRFWLVDDLYTAEHGRGSLNNLYGTPRYVDWITKIIRPFVGETVFELGAGNGNLTGRLMGKRTRYVAAEHDPLYLHSLRNRFLRTPNVETRRLDPESPAGWEDLEQCAKTGLCINLLEYADNPEQILANLHKAIAPGGNLILLVPQGKKLYGSLDRTLGVRRRFNRNELEDLLTRTGFEIEQSWHLNKIARAGWWLYSTVLRRQNVNKFALKLFDKTVWLWRGINPLLPWQGLSLIVVARNVTVHYGEGSISANEVG